MTLEDKTDDENQPLVDVLAAMFRWVVSRTSMEPDRLMERLHQSLQDEASPDSSPESNSPVLEAGHLLWRDCAYEPALDSEDEPCSSPAE